MDFCLSHVLKLCRRLVWQLDIRCELFRQSYVIMMPPGGRLRNLSRKLLEFLREFLTSDHVSSFPVPLNTRWSVITSNWLTISKKTLKTIHAHSGQRQPDNFDENFSGNALLGKYLKRKCWLEQYQQLSFKYFVKSFIIPKLLSKA